MFHLVPSKQKLSSIPYAILNVRSNSKLWQNFSRIRHTKTDARPCDEANVWRGESSGWTVCHKRDTRDDGRSCECVRVFSTSTKSWNSIRISNTDEISDVIRPGVREQLWRDNWDDFFGRIFLRNFRRCKRVDGGRCASVGAWPTRTLRCRRGCRYCRCAGKKSVLFLDFTFLNNFSCENDALKTILLDTFGK